MKIYTKTGDKGQTSLATGKRVSKSCLQLEAYGTADELNSFFGLLRSGVTKNSHVWAKDVNINLRWIQNRLFDIGAILAGSDLSFSIEYVEQLEKWIDEMQTELPTVRAFILPAGSESMARCHVCRTIARRLERNIIRLIESDEKECPEVLSFINRLSDYCFVLARWMGQNEQIEIVTWEK